VKKLIHLRALACRLALCTAASLFAAGEALANGAQYGYVHRDSSGALCRYDFTDISPSPTAEHLALPLDGMANVTLPFDFTFYGVRSRALRIGRNGGALFDATNGALGPFHASLPAASMPLALLPFWSAFEGDEPLDETDGVYVETLGSAPNRRFVVQWHRLRAVDPDPPEPPPSSPVTFQLVLHERTNNISFQYQDTDFGDVRFDAGASATVGINRGASEAVLYSFDSASLQDDFAVCFVSPQSEPDAFGYTYASSSGPSCEYDFDDISASGTALGLADDGEANVTMPFQLFFYGQRSGHLRVGNNGGVLFAAASGDVTSASKALPSASYPMALFPLWTDIDNETGDVFVQTLGTAPERRFVVQWHDRPHFNGLGSGTFQLVLFETTNRIAFRYQDVHFAEIGFDPVACPDGIDAGACATVGINQDGVNALQYSFKSAALHDALAICFTPPSADLSITKSSGLSSAMPGTAVSYTITVTNEGPHAVLGGSVRDELPAKLVDASWTCTATEGSSCSTGVPGAFEGSVDLLADGSAAFLLEATVALAATGTLTNTARALVPSSLVDSEPANDSATDSIPLDVLPTPTPTSTATATPTATSTATPPATSTATATPPATPTATSTPPATSTPSVTPTAPVQPVIGLTSSTALAGAPVKMTGYLKPGRYDVCIVPNATFTIGEVYAGTPVVCKDVYVEHGPIAPTVVWEAAAAGSYDLLVLSSDGSKTIVTGDALSAEAGLIVAEATAVPGPSLAWLVLAVAAMQALMPRARRRLCRPAWSWRRAVSGATRVARRAGASVATSAMAASTAEIATKVSGSVACTSKNQPASPREGMLVI
jgi:uncharacterized repeat protein (TIGR01451 family)